MNRHFRVSGSTFQKLEELGVSAPAVLRRAGLPQAYSREPRVLLKTEELFALWRAIGEVSADPTIGLRLGTETKAERFHPVGLVSLSSEDFGTSMDQMARYKQLTCPEEIVQELDKKEWRIQFRWLLADEIEPPVLIECVFAWVLSTARVGTGTRISPLRVEFVERRAHAKAIERHFGCPVVCGAKRNVIVFRADDAKRQFVTRNAELLSLLAPQFEQELKEEKGRGRFRGAGPRRNTTPAHRPASEHGGHRRCASCQFADAAAALAIRGIQLPKDSGSSSPPTCPPLSEQFRPGVERSCLPARLRGRQLLRSCLPHVGRNTACPLARNAAR